MRLKCNDSAPDKTRIVVLNFTCAASLSFSRSAPPNIARGFYIIWEPTSKVSKLAILGWHGPIIASHTNLDRNVIIGPRLSVTLSRHAASALNLRVCRYYSYRYVHFVTVGKMTASVCVHCSGVRIRMAVGYIQVYKESCLLTHSCDAYSQIRVHAPTDSLAFACIRVHAPRFACHARVKIFESGGSIQKCDGA